MTVPELTISTEAAREIKRIIKRVGDTRAALMQVGVGSYCGKRYIVATDTHAMICAHTQKTETELPDGSYLINYGTSRAAGTSLTLIPNKGFPNWVRIVDQAHGEREPIGTLRTYDGQPHIRAEVAPFRFNANLFPQYGNWTLYRLMCENGGLKPHLMTGDTSDIFIIMPLTETW